MLVRLPQTWTVNGLSASDDVGVLQERIARKMGLPRTAAWLTHRGRRLERGRTVSSYGLRAGDTVHLAVRGRGGGCASSKVSDDDNLAAGTASVKSPRNSADAMPRKEERGHVMYTVRDQERPPSTQRLSSADARWDGAGFDDWASEHAVWIRVQVLRDLEAGSRCIRTASDLTPERDYLVGPSPDPKLHLYAVCDFSVTLTEPPADLSLGVAEDPRRSVLQTLVVFLKDAPGDALVYWHLLSLLIRPPASDVPARLRMPSDLHRLFAYYRIRTVVVPNVPPNTLGIFRQGRIMAYLTLAQFCQRIVRPSEESPTFVRDQLEEGLSPSKFFDVPTLMRQCTFRRHTKYTAVGDMLARVLCAMRPVKFDREGFLIFCEEVQPPPPASPPLPLGQRP